MQLYVFSGIISNRGNSKHLTRPIEQIDVEEDDDDEEEEDDEDEEEDFIFTGCSINRPVTGIFTVKIALLTLHVNWFAWCKDWKQKFIRNIHYI